ncbi:WD40 repeat domain-containing protein [Bauldia litoralis]|uniref:WD-40 repeat-containing protein n=1 Tax=Bauldia litoralis TaxID=665467 RepID=A0A1G6AI47_9HYPH|nr:WD40 repeat domain-containing protein [Bauldia litoralis]SDB08067.1 WD-40 repeat-containing protein [Bauldia litoralis]
MTQIDEKAFGAYVVESVFLGDTAVFALGDGTIRRVTGEDEQTTEVHAGAVLAATRSRDGKALITGGDDGLIAVTDAAGTVEAIAERKGKWIDQVAGGPSGAVAFASGRRAAVRLGDGRERVFDLPRAVGGLAFAPKGLRLAVARYDGVTLWWAGTEAAPASLEWKGAHIAASFSPDGKYLVTAMQDSQLHGWRLDDGKDMRMSGYPSKPRSLSWSVKGRFLASSGANAAVLWPFHHKDGPQGKPPLQLGAREVLVTRVACHPREEIVAVGYQDGMIMAVRFDEEEVLLRRPGDGPVTALGWDDRGTRLAFGTEQGAGGIVTVV